MYLPNWLPQWVPIAGLLIGFLVLIWRIIPEERRYGFWLFTGLLRLNMSLKLAGTVKHNGEIAKYFLWFNNKGAEPKFPVYLETWEPSKRWCVAFDTQNALTHVWWNEVGGATNDENNQRHNIHLLKTAQDDKQIGYIHMYPDWAGKKQFREYLTYRLKCAGVTIAEEKLEIS
jgi:hypothetical protein